MSSQREIDDAVEEAARRLREEVGRCNRLEFRISHSYLPRFDYADARPILQDLVWDVTRALAKSHLFTRLNLKGRG